MKARFVFIDPPSPPGFVSFKHSHAGYGEFCPTSRLRVPTLDIFHNASLLLEDGFPVDIVDSVLSGHSIEECAAEVAARKPDWAVFRTASASLAHDLRAAQALRERSEAKILFYGPWLAQEPETARASPAVDGVILGDASLALREIARRGSCEDLPAAPFLENLDSLPIPRWDLVDYKRYSYVTSQTSWGCPLGCGYCPYPLAQGTRWRARGIAGVVAEFSALRDRYGLRFVLLRDPEFTFNRRRTVELCAALIEAGTPIAWGCETRLDTLDEELLALMAKAGCLSVQFGVESLNPETLALMGRPNFGVSVIRDKVAAFKRHGILTYALYVIGLPGETRQSTRELIDFALDLGSECASFSMATAFPGTSLARMAEERGWIVAENRRRLTSSIASMRNEHMSAEEIKELYLEAKSRWRQLKRREPSPLSSPA